MYEFVISFSELASRGRAPTPAGFRPRGHGEFPVLSAYASKRAREKTHGSRRDRVNNSSAVKEWQCVSGRGKKYKQD